MSSLKKKSQVVMLPTINEDRIKTNIYKFIGTRRDIFDKRIKGNLALTASPDNKDYQCQHLYIISSDEDIKEGDYYICNSIIKKCKRIAVYTNVYLIDELDNEDIITTCKKIIATTNKSITIDTEIFGKDRYKQFPEPSTAFINSYIKAYNEGNPITEVLVEYETFQNMDVYKDKHNIKRDHVGDDGYVYNDYKLKVAKDNTITIKPIQQKETWNKKEVITLIKPLFYALENEGIKGYDNFENWIEQNL